MLSLSVLTRAISKEALLDAETGCNFVLIFGGFSDAPLVVLLIDFIKQHKTMSVKYQSLFFCYQPNESTQPVGPIV